MEEQKKISPRKVARFAIGSLLVVIFMVALIAASRNQANHVAEGLQVTIQNENEHAFISSKDIELMLSGQVNSYRNVPIADLDLNKLEKKIETNPWVINAEVFVDNARKLQVQVQQRVPVARIFNYNGGSCYMDSALRMLPLSSSYAYPAPVFTNVPLFNNDSFGRSFKAKIAFLSEVIASDSFWNAQVTQVEVQPDQTFILIPMIGNQRILFGDTSNAKAKLGNLFAFYKNVSKKIGWDKYQTLDIRYQGQVIASPAIGYVPPVVTDTAKDIATPAVTATTAHVPAIAINNKPGEKAKPVIARPKEDIKPEVRQEKVIVRHSQKAINAKTSGKPKEQPKKVVKPATQKQGKEGKYIYQGKK